MVAGECSLSFFQGLILALLDTAVFYRHRPHIEYAQTVKFKPYAPQEVSMKNDQKRLARAVREACVDAALRAYEEAGISGLCCEGRWEIAVDAMRNLDLAALIDSVDLPSHSGKGGS